MLSKFVRAAPRLLQQSSKLNQIPAVYRLASNQSAPVIQSDYKPSGHVPNDENYHQIPVVLDGQEHVCSPELLDRPYPPVPTLEEISIERQPTEEEQNLPAEFQVRTLEDKLRVWFGADMPTKYDDQRPERDLVNYPRIPPHLTDPPATRIYFLPESWFKFFEEKTGRTGGYVFGTTFLTFLLSKEYICYNDNAHTGAALAAIGYIFAKKWGKDVNNWMTSHFVKEHQGWIDWQAGMKKLLNDHVAELKQIEERSINPGPIYEAKRENLLLQQEAEYRRRLMEVYNEVKRKLDYQVAIEEAKKSFTRKHLVNWVIDNVNKNVNADLEKAVLKQCVLDLKVLSEKRRNVI